MNFLILSLGLLLMATTSSAVSFVECVEPCRCHRVEDDKIFADCSALGLTQLPEFVDKKIHYLDLSSNKFTQFPLELNEFVSLLHLDISENFLTHLSPFALDGLVSLKTLNMGKNNISSWTDINPNKVLEPALSLMELSLAENPLTSLSSNDENLILISPTLTHLDLSRCKIAKITGQEVLQGLKNLGKINLHGNPIMSMPNIISESLTSIDLSNTGLGNLRPNVFAHLPSLTYINLAKNHRLVLEGVHSVSVKRIDLSYCNMDAIEINGFPNLLTAILRGNMFRQLTRTSFKNNKLLENLDLSMNSINYIQEETFQATKNLKQLDLSFNMIAKIERDTFKDNEILTNINLSRNYLSHFSKIFAASLTSFNMSSCEILTIAPDALNGLPEIVDLDLSNNLITAIPDNLMSDTLQSLDLSLCRISIIRNTTFMGLPELSRINLSGNRLTRPLRPDYFQENRFLSEIWLGDNSWLCDCKQEGFLDFYLFLTDPPARIWDRRSLRCAHPEEFYGKTWDQACNLIWFPVTTMGTTEKVWTIFMVCVIALCGAYCIVLTVRKAVQGRKFTRAERERERNLEEQREMRRQNNVRMQQEAQVNAPDPRESRPPCYEDAILLPRLDGSFASLDELGPSTKSKRRKRNNTDKNEEENDEVTVRRNRSRSEEVISMRETYIESVNNERNTRIPPRVHPFEVDAIERQSRVRDSDEPTENELHYHSTDIMSLNHNRSTLPSNVVRIQSQPVAASIEEIQDFQSKESSPYAKRKIQHMSSFKGQRPPRVAPPPVPSPPVSDGEEIIVIENYYKRDSPLPPKRNSSSDSDSNSGEFATFSSSEMESLNRERELQRSRSRNSRDGNTSEYDRIDVLPS